MVRELAGAVPGAERRDGGAGPGEEARRRPPPRPPPTTSAGSRSAPRPGGPAALRELLAELLPDPPVSVLWSSSSANGVKVGNDARIEARTVLWAAGVQATALAQSLPGPQDRTGRVLVTPTLQVAGADSIFVIGDLASIAQDGKPVPGVAYAAKQMGAYAAHAIAQHVQRDGELASGIAPFRYRDRGSLATIGRKAAVALLPGGIRLSGLVAWWTWLLVHIFFLIGFRNRITTMVDWMLAYFTHQRHARLIFADAATRDALQNRS